MNIVLLPSPPFEEIGGVSTHVFMLAKGLGELGHRVFVIREYPPRWFRWPFVRLPELLLEKISLNFARKYRRKVDDLYFAIDALWKTKGELQVLNIQNVQHAGIVKWLRRMTGCKAILTVHGYLTYEAESRKWCVVGDRTHQWLWALETEGYDQFDAIVCVGSRAGSYVQQFTHKPITIIPNGLDTDLFRPASGDFNPKTKIHILFVGLLQPAKGIMDAIRAIQALVRDYNLNVVLRVAGKGLQEQEARQYVAEQGLGDRVVFLGALNKEKMPDFYRSGDMLLFPSKQAGLSGRSEESSPYAVLEAMSSGLPIIAYRTSALQEHVQDGTTGYLVEPGDIVSLVKHVQELCLDTELMQKMGRAARIYCEQNYSQKKMAEQYMNVYAHCFGMIERLHIS
ncbi:glycosyltransferase family 4 protein [Sporomusa sp. KB1]|jgi:glycosyltransferase involved in cell wall biosynthesis|uniref:glycosyltransferase family 4 protein n=1 Tax=Sporomusa sp. KB1 TaxID=943346 RepID=UPI0011A5FE38|nr:glycosyltransferase family 4 protein [Sporomusa sp. KB1]TWH47683.1 glycosyltransferase involved in cell wall biosynthesis [Sporomusa sp. KB1]